MKEIKILALETLYKENINKITGERTVTHSGVDFARIIQPLTHLSKIPGFKVDISYVLPTMRDVEEMAKKYDVVYSSYIDNSTAYVAMKVMGNKYGMKYVVDCDDHIWSVSQYHPYYEKYKVEYGADGRPKFSEGLFKQTVIMGDADYVTTTNMFLKHRISEFTKKPHEKIFIFPNCIDLSLYDINKVKPREKDGKIYITYHGGGSHYPDVMKPAFIDALKIIMKKYPNVQFRTTGFFFPQLKTHFGNRYEFKLARADVYGWINELWPEHMSESDIVVAPLENTQYSRAKSYIKYLEYSAGKKAGVYENIDPYNEVVKDGENGFLAHSKEDWVEKLSILIEDEEKRNKMAEVAYKDVVDHHQMKDNLDPYIEFFRKIVESN